MHGKFSVILSQTISSGQLHFLCQSYFQGSKVKDMDKQFYDKEWRMLIIKCKTTAANKDERIQIDCKQMKLAEMRNLAWVYKYSHGFIVILFLMQIHRIFNWFKMLIFSEFLLSSNYGNTSIPIIFIKICTVINKHTDKMTHIFTI